MNLPFVRDVMFTNGVDFFTTTGAADPAVRDRELQARVDELPVRRPDDGVAIGRQLAHRVRTRIRDRRARDRRRPRPRRHAPRAARGRPAHSARARIAAEGAGWESPAPEGSARGITCSGFLGHSAQVTEVSRDPRGRVHVERIVFVLDCGITVNPDLIRAQVEGGVRSGQRRRLGSGRARQGREDHDQTFDPYPVTRMRSVPQLEVHLIESTEADRRRGSERPLVCPEHWRTPSRPSRAPGSASSPSPRPQGRLRKE